MYFGLVLLSNLFIIIYILNNFLEVFSFKNKKIDIAVDILALISFIFLIVFMYKYSYYIYDGDSIEPKLMITFYTVTFFLVIDGIISVFINFIVFLIRKNKK